jgi:hypothetical protein
MLPNVSSSLWSLALLLHKLKKHKRLGQGRQVKSLFDFIARTEIEKYSPLSRNAETGDSDKEALFASASGVEVSEFLGGNTR